MTIGCINVKGKTISLNARFDVAGEKVSYVVEYDGTKLYFLDFSDAARLYKSLPEELLMGCEMESRIEALEEIYGKEVA